MNAQMGQMDTRMDNQDQLMDSRFNTLTTMLHEKFASLTIPSPQTLPVNTTLASPSHISGLDTNFTTAFSSIPVSLPVNLLHTRPPQPTISPPGYSPQHMGFSTGFNTKYTAAPTSPFQQRPYPYPTQPSPQQSYVFPPFIHTSTNFPPNPTNPPPPYRTPKIELSPFVGSNLLEWLFQAEQFFLFYNIPPKNRLPMTSFYMKGDTLGWYKWMFQNNQLSDWATFSWSLELRFGPSTYENHQAQLFKLRQSGSITEYQAQFEKLGNRVLGLPPEALLNCFISGLKPDIRNEIAIQRPYTITQAVGLAKLIESKVNDSKPKFSRPTTQTTPYKPFSTVLQPLNSGSTPPQTQPTHPPTTSTPPTSTNYPIKRITAAQRD